MDLEVAAFGLRFPLHLGMACATPHVSPHPPNPLNCSSINFPLWGPFSAFRCTGTSPIFKINELKIHPLTPTPTSIYFSLCAIKSSQESPSRSPCPGCPSALRTLCRLPPSHKVLRRVAQASYSSLRTLPPGTFLFPLPVPTRFMFSLHPGLCRKTPSSPKLFQQPHPNLSSSHLSRARITD